MHPGCRDALRSRDPSPFKLPDAFTACRTCRTHAVQKEQLVTVEPALNLILQARSINMKDLLWKKATEGQRDRFKTKKLLFASKT